MDAYNEKSVALVETYNAFCQQFVPMLEEAVKLNDAIRKMNAQGSGLLTTIPTIAEGLIEGVKLPSPSGGFLWPDPRRANVVAAQWADAMAQVHSSPLRQSHIQPTGTRQRRRMTKGSLPNGRSVTSNWSARRRRQSGNMSKRSIARHEVNVN